MNRRSAGVGFFAIAAFLYAARYVAAAVFGSGLSSWSRELYQGLLQYVGADLWAWSAAAAVVGAGYLLAAELEGRRRA